MKRFLLILILPILLSAQPASRISRQDTLRAYLADTIYVKNRFRVNAIARFDSIVTIKGFQVDSTTMVTAGAIQVLTATKYVAPRWYYNSVGVDTVVSRGLTYPYIQNQYAENIQLTRSSGHLLRIGDVLGINNGSNILIDDDSRILYLSNFSSSDWGGATITNGFWQGSAIDTAYLGSVSGIDAGTNITVTNNGGNRYKISASSSNAFKWNVSGSAQQQDSLRFIEGSNVTLSQSGNTITIGASGTATNTDSLGHVYYKKYARLDTINAYARQEKIDTVAPNSTGIVYLNSNKILGGVTMSTSQSYSYLFGNNFKNTLASIFGFGLTDASADTFRVGHSFNVQNVPIVNYYSGATNSPVSGGASMGAFALMNDQAADSSSFVIQQYLGVNGSGGTTTTSVEFDLFKNTRLSNYNRWDGTKYLVALRIDTSRNIRFNASKSADFNYGNVYIDNGSLILATALDTAYSNAVATVTTKAPWLTATRYNTKDIQLSLDTTATGLRGTYVPYSGANASVNLGAQTLTTTGSGSFGAISGTTATFNGDITDNKSSGDLSWIMNAPALANDNYLIFRKGGLNKWALWNRANQLRIWNYYTGTSAVAIDSLNNAVTLTGALSGTSATFTGAVTGGSTSGASHTFYLDGPTAQTFTINRAGSTQKIEFQTNPTSTQIYTTSKDTRIRTTDGFNLFLGTNGTDLVRIYPWGKIELADSLDLQTNSLTTTGPVSTGALKISGTTWMDASRNMSNIASLSVIGNVTASGIPSDSTGLPTGGLYFKASDGTVRRKY